MNDKLPIDIHEWDNDTPESKAEHSESRPPQLFKVTNNISRNTFNAVRDNPGQTRVYIVRLLDKQGHNHKSTASLITQMLRQGMITEREGRLFAQQPEYTPIKSYRLQKARKAQQKHKAPKQVQSKGIAALPAATTSAVAHEFTRPVVEPSKAALPEHIQSYVDSVLHSMSILQAKHVYQALHELFGGKR